MRDLVKQLLSLNMLLLVYDAQTQEKKDQKQLLTCNAWPGGMKLIRVTEQCWTAKANQLCGFHWTFASSTQHINIRPVETPQAGRSVYQVWPVLPPFSFNVGSFFYLSVSSRFPIQRWHVARLQGFTMRLIPWLWREERH